MTGLEEGGGLGREGARTEDFHQDVVVDNLDADVSVQTGSNETTY